tara:strand:+ start:14780 stop:16177 length:1398 start_codon:yes stop_codon:yes gene_type:complete
MNIEQAKQFINKAWDDSIVSTLEDYIRIPNKSPAFDPDWKANGYMDQAMDLLKNWAEQHAPKGMTMELIETDGRTPLLFMEVEGQTDETVLLYGHMDKQPEMTGWDEGKDPWTPVRDGDKLYGRGGADDGYSMFAALTAINALQEQGIAHPRCVILIEACEESGSYDLPLYVDELKDRIGVPKLVVALDSGCANYKQLWVTTNLRGVVTGTLKVDILKEGVHSGYASGIVPSSFRIIRQLLSRVENEMTGEITVKEMNVDIPQQRIDQAKATADVVGDGVKRSQPFVDGAKPTLDDNAELILNRTWRPTLSVTGVAGIPDVASAGNVLRPNTSLALSFRAPPTADVHAAGLAIKKILETNPPYNAKVEFELDEAGPGWNAPLLADWLEKANNEASEAFYGKPAMYFGEGGSIPFMGMLGEKFPEAQFLITGVLGPKSNAHGPNEFLHIPMGKCITGCVAYVLSQV